MIALRAAGYAKVSVGIAKLVVKMKQANATTALGKASAAWKKLGSSRSVSFKELVNQIKALGNTVEKVCNGLLAAISAVGTAHPDRRNLPRVLLVASARTSPSRWH